MKTSMQDLRSDLLESVISGKESLQNINDEFIRKTCITVLESVVKDIINRIDVELLGKEKQQIVSAYCSGRMSAITKEIISFEQYYQDTFGDNPEVGI